ncbi:MAG: diguanylate cyclase [Magnetospiraceae bacterium]
MIPAPHPSNETDRLAALERMRLLSTPREADVDRITRITSECFDVEIALVTLIDRDRQWFKSRIGLEIAETDRDISFCGHTILTDEVMVVTDALEDVRFQDNPLVLGDPLVRFYAGAPIKSEDGYRIGTLCIISRQPREFPEREISLLKDLAATVELAFSHRKLNEVQTALLDSLLTAQRDRLVDPLSGLWNRRGLDELFDRELARAVRESRDLTVALVDVDHFKTINDRFGHPKGDEAIRIISSILVNATRTSDVVARYGGEEFAIIAPGIAAVDLNRFGNKILSVIRRDAVLSTAEGPYSFTASLGIAYTKPTEMDKSIKSALFAGADTALYSAKAKGRNRFEMTPVVLSTTPRIVSG